MLSESIYDAIFPNGDRKQAYPQPLLRAIWRAASHANVTESLNKEPESKVEFRPEDLAELKRRDTDRLILYLAFDDMSSRAQALAAASETAVLKSELQEASVVLKALGQQYFA